MLRKELWPCELGLVGRGKWGRGAKGTESSRARFRFGVAAALGAAGRGRAARVTFVKMRD